jgi:periplasmic divalent cation tolerance protein
MSESRVVVTTTGSAEDAERLARRAVEARLAACVQIVGPVRSVFRWDGQIAVESEWQVVAKTAADRVADLTEVLVAEHPYDVPEVIATPIVDGYTPYLDWVVDETRG